MIRARPSPPAAPSGRARRACRSALAAIALPLALGGCIDPHSSTRDGDLHEEHAGHVIPAHKPRTFPEAVRRLRALNAAIGRIVARGGARSFGEDRSLPHALDIANWLPEIAADSDMPEGPWEQVNARAARIVVDYEQGLAGTPAGGRPVDAAAAVRDADRRIAELEAIATRADPRWFDRNDAEGTPVSGGIR